MQRSVAFTEELSQYLVPGGVILSPARITAASAIAAPWPEESRKRLSRRHNSVASPGVSLATATRHVTQQG